MVPSPNAVALLVGAQTAPALDVADAASARFSVSLGNFNGPFDLLLSLISKHELDLNDISLSRVTDEFISYLRGLDSTADLDEATEFLVVAATLLDLKVAGLLPQGELVDAEGAALLEARDLLFARLLQYRAFKQASAWVADRLQAESTRWARSVALEGKYRTQTPELRWTLSAADFAVIAELAFTPKELPSIALDHLHSPLVSVREQGVYLVHMLRGGSPRTFGELIADTERPGIVVARFLAVLELYRAGAVSCVQLEPLGELTLSWCAVDWNDDSLALLGADYGN